MVCMELQLRNPNFDTRSMPLMQLRSRPPPKHQRLIFILVQLFRDIFHKQTKTLQSAVHTQTQSSKFSSPEYDDKMYIVIHGQAVKQVQQVGEGGLSGSMFRSDSRSSNKQDSGAKGGSLFRMRNFSQNNQSSQVMDAPIVPKMNLLSPQAAMFSPVASISVKRAETDGISHLVQTYDPNEAEQQKPKDDFKDVQTLNQGSPFNEQALTKIKALAMIIKSRIKATQDTHFAVLSIADYHRCLAKMEARAITKTLYFLQELPFFKLWSKTMLSKLITSFKTVKFIRGQVIFKEGQANDEIFIVRSGEFSANRTIMFQNSNINQSVVQFVRGQKTHSTLRSVFSPQFNQLTKANSITNASKTRESMQLFLFGKGQIFGEERFVRDEKLAPYTAVCQSLEGECLRISSSDFMKKVYQNTDALSVLKQNINQKETKIQYKQVSGIYNHLWSQKNLAGADAVGASSDKYSDAKISKMLLHNNNEKREGLRQIVEGYPNLKKISNLIRDDQDNIDKSQFSASLNNNRMASTGFIPESKLFSLPSSPAMLNTSFNFSQTATFCMDCGWIQFEIQLIQWRKAQPGGGGVGEWHPHTPARFASCRGRMAQRHLRPH